MTESGKELASPCVNICAIDADKVCLGCYRSLDEIAAWSQCSDQQKIAILDRVKQRRESGEQAGK